ncbi:MAG TPA: MFS transporter [Candidatus Baltobacteraceae bacterium]|jgi:SHS family lactate transporter-like MFS transporter|nr:MFS transporter [Candidatus Baltobacteraceae bacterium]
MRDLTKNQRNAFIASFLGWTLDAFDFFLVVVALRHVASDLHGTYLVASIAVTLTLALRPLGALIFGWFADRYGRRVPLMVDIALYSILELATAFSPNLTVFILLRALFGVAMGGEWGLGAALAMESLPAQKRGVYSGILQEGYAVGNLLAGLVFALLFTTIGWRGMFVIGALPALLILYIRANVPESPAWLAKNAQRISAGPADVLALLRSRWPLFLYAIFFMAAFNFMSHGTQDPYVSAFLEGQHKFSPALAGTINSIAAIGAIAGGIVFGALSQRFGRRRMILVCGVLGLVLIPLWAFGQTIAVLAIGGFLMQVAVQGAWGIIPAHLNEISPPDVRGTFPGFTYQLGNLIASGTLTIIAALADTRFGTRTNPNYAVAMAVFAGAVFVAVILMTLLGYAVVPEDRQQTLT